MSEPTLRITQSSSSDWNGRARTYVYGACSLGDWSAGPFNGMFATLSAFDQHVREECRGSSVVCYRCDEEYVGAGWALDVVARMPHTCGKERE